MHRIKCLPAAEVLEAACVPDEDSVDFAGQEPGEEDTSLTLAVNEDSPAQTLSDLAEMGEDYDNTIVGIEPDAGLMRLTQDSVFHLQAGRLGAHRVLDAGDAGRGAAVDRERREHRCDDVAPALGVRGIPAPRPGG